VQNDSEGNIIDRNFTFQISTNLGSGVNTTVVAPQINSINAIFGINNIANSGG